MSSPWNIAPAMKDYEIGAEHGKFLLEPRLQILRARDGHDWTGDLAHVSFVSGSENGKVVFRNASGKWACYRFRGGRCGDQGWGRKGGIMCILVLVLEKCKMTIKVGKSEWKFTGWRCMSLDKLSGLGARRLMNLVGMSRSTAFGILNERGEMRRC
jgi:hypothetical protein